MGRIGLAFRAFFGLLFGSITADAFRSWLDAGQAPALEPPAVAAAPPVAAPPTPQRPSRGSRRSDAVSLLAALQREARFIDLVQEPLTQYTDAQIGAAARDVLRDCQRVIERIFGLQAITDAAENSPIETPADMQDGRWRVTGKVQGEPPFRGRLIHHGWEASRCEIPQWNGADAAAQVVAPAEVECAN